MSAWFAGSTRCCCPASWEPAAREPTPAYDALSRLAHRHGVRGGLRPEFFPRVALRVCRLKS
jgi:hypothetical protein